MPHRLTPNSKPSDPADAPIIQQSKPDQFEIQELIQIKILKLIYDVDLINVQKVVTIL